MLAACMVVRHPAGIASATAPLSPTYTTLGPVEESSCQYWIVFIPFGRRERTDQVLTTALKQRGADALVSATVELRSSVFMLPLFGSECTIVKGLAVKNVR
jgi:hypothetical protein